MKLQQTISGKIAILLSVVFALSGAAAAQGKIAFESARDGNWEIYSMNPDGSSQVRLTNDAALDTRPVVSPDGTKIAFMSDRTGNSEVYIMNADGSNVVNISNHPLPDGHPTFSPDGTKLLFDAFGNGFGTRDIVMTNLDGTGRVNLTNHMSDDVMASYAGGLIVFMSYRDDNWELYSMNPDGSGQTRLTNNLVYDGDHSVSPDGTRIAFLSNQDFNPDVYVMNADGTGVTRLTFDGLSSNASFSPDGSKIIFGSFRDGNWEVYVMNADGSNQTRVTNVPGFDANPSWGGSSMDTDSDGVIDAIDNCPLTANSDQADVDGDGIGNVCDSENGPPNSINSCQNGGWQLFDSPVFRNQGECIKYFNNQN